MSPANTQPSGRGRTRLLLSSLATVLVVGVAVALWWTGHPPASGRFDYIHGALTPAAGSDRQVVFRLHGPGGERTYTQAQLEALPAVRYRATQPQLNETHEYTGVPLRDLAAAAGLSGKNLRITADDQFGATLLASDFEAFPVMLAYLADGKPISVAGKGPLEVVFPTADHPARFPGQTHGSQWVWYARALAAAP